MAKIILDEEEVAFYVINILVEKGILPDSPSLEEGEKYLWSFNVTEKGEVELNIQVAIPKEPEKKNYENGDWMD
jgi:hypothetical protein